MEIEDSNGNPLNEGDTVVLIKSLKVKGTSNTLKGQVIKNIHLTDDADEAECRVNKSADGVAYRIFKAGLIAFN